MAPRSAVVLAAAALSAAMFAGADAQAFVPVQSTNRKMLAARLSALHKSAMAPVPAPAPGPSMVNAMGADLAESGSSRRLQAAQTKTVAGRGTAAAPAGAVAGKLPLIADSGAPAAGVDLAEAALPADTMKPSKQMRMGVGAKAAMPIKRVATRIFGAGGPGPAPAPAPSADAMEASGM